MKKENIAIIILAILYAVCLIGSTIFQIDLFKLFPIILIISATILFYFHQPKNVLFWIWTIGVFQAAFVLALLGITTGRIFGQYFYGNNLGFKIADVPVIIGLNWVMLCYVSMHVTQVILNKIVPNKNVHIMAKAALGSLFMLIIDIFIENIAPQLDFWYWKNSIAPIQNYTAWYIFSFVFMYIYHQLDLPLTNKIAPWLYGFLLTLFVSLNIW